MNGTKAAAVARRPLAALNRDAVALAIFAATLCLSAFLLFSVQPMFARMVLPRLGGSPSVWAVSMCFFQAMLLLGYCYAHGLNRILHARHAVFVHLTLMAAGLLALPIAVTASEPPAGDAYLWLVGVLGVGVGVPFFIVSASAPLLQSWFARSGHPHAADPYFLYGASNLGSLAALIAYPIAIEPLFGLALQARLWSTGFVLLAGAILIAGAVMLTGLARAAAESPQVGTVTARPSLRQHAHWIALAAVPSGLLVAYTTFLTTDIASAPFLWVLPLAVFLLTFIMVFKERPTLSHKGLIAWQPRIVAFAVIGLGLLGDMGWYLGTVFGFLAFAVTALVCHRELYDRRPAGEHLTEFYLSMSLGGVLGGVFAALVAPQIFNSILEFPLLMAAGLLLRPGVFRAAGARARWRSAALALGLGLAMLVAIDQLITAELLPADMRIKMVLVVLLACGILLFSDAFERQMASAALVVLALGILPFGRNVGEAERSFFGVNRVVESAEGQHRLLFHGVTMHGAMRIRDAQGRPVAQALPATYYHPHGTMARGIELARALIGGTDAPVRIGIVGLGTGAMACNGKPGDHWRFYEIDPVVVRIARDASRFTFLSRCTPTAPVIVGDARLTLTKEGAGTFDYLVIDAFSSDAIPVHLLTVEALELYLAKLAPKGVLALHVSNRHLDLPPIIAATAARLAIAGAVYVLDVPSGPAYDVSASQVILIAREPAAIEAALRLKGAVLLKPGTARAWTDDYSNILGALIDKRLR